METLRQRRRVRTKRGREPETGLREMLLVQCIVSVIILVMALGISFLPMGMTGNLRLGIKRALSQPGDAESLLQVAEGFAGKYNNMKASIKTMFGAAETPPLPQGNVDLESLVLPEGGELAPDMPALGAAEDETISPGGARIDENVLHSIDYLYEDESEKK